MRLVLQKLSQIRCPNFLIVSHSRSATSGLTSDSVLVAECVTRIHTGFNEIPGGLMLKRSMALNPTENEDGARVLLAELLRLFLWFTAKYSTRSATKMAKVGRAMGRKF
jgi:hypothetical protein